MIKKLAMKEDEKRRDTAHNEAPPAQGSSRDNNARNEADTKRDEDARNKTNMKDRARKSFHNDGPGGNYAGY